MQVNSLIGIKTKQSQAFLQDGIRIPLTAVQVSGNVITQIKTSDKEGYNGLQIGLGFNKKAKKQIVGHAKKAGLENTPRFFREIKVSDLEGASLGLQLNAKDVFSPGDIIDVTGTSKGKGWAGGVKRWGFHGGPRTHGQSDRERAPGSIGQTTTPGRVYKGKKMAGRMGSDTVTVKNLEVIEITNDGILLIKGLVPGSLNTVLTIKKVGENKKFVPLYKEPSSADSASEASSAKEAATEGQTVVEEPVSEEAQVEKKTEKAPEEEGAGSQSHIAGDAQQPAEETNTEPASLSDSSAPASNENQEVNPEPTISSPANEPPAVSSEDKKEEPKEDK